MDAGFSIKPVAGVAVTDYARPTASATGVLPRPNCLLHKR